jgi:hypothetical protein
VVLFDASMVSQLPRTDGQISYDVFILQGILRFFSTCKVFCLKQRYPPVICHIAIENHNFQWVSPL